MRERTKSSESYWLVPLLLMIFPSLVLIAWWRWTPPKTEAVEELLPPPIGTSRRTIDEPGLAERRSVPPAPVVTEPFPPAPPVDRRTTTKLEESPSPPKRHPAPGDVSDAAIAAFDSETIAMLNNHKYWSAEKQALVDGLYDQWLNAKQQGADAENARQQIAWALEGRFMENY